MKYYWKDRLQDELRYFTFENTYQNAFTVFIFYQRQTFYRSPKIRSHLQRNFQY